MAITAYTGLPGSGKSYGVVENVIIPAVEKGRTVFTNIPINKSARDDLALVEQFDLADIEADPNWFKDTFKAGSVMVLDEAWRLWPSGMKANQIEEAHKSFLAEHRHMVGTDGHSTDIVIVTQDLAQIASYPRSLIETTFRSVKLVMVGQSNRYRIDVYQGAVTGHSPPDRLRLRQMFGKYKPEVYACYTSQTMSQSDEHGSEERIDGRASLLNSPFFRYGIPAAVLGAIFIIYAFSGLWNSFFATDQPEVPLDDARALQDAEPQSGVAQSRAPQPKQSRKHPLADFPAYISFNMGRIPNVMMKVTFKDGEKTFTLAEADLYRTGYKLLKVTECLAYLEYEGNRRPVTCQSEESSAAPIAFNL